MPSLAWDAKDQNANVMPDGTYRFEILAEDLEGEALGVTTFANGKVSGVTFNDNATYLITDERKIPVGEVIQVNEGQTAENQE